MERRIVLDIPLKLGVETELTLKLLDNELIGSRNHFVRFDLYTTYAPSHPDRHLGYWDLALHTTRDDRIPLVFRNGKLYRRGYLLRSGFRTKWKGQIEPSGYCSLYVSLWEYKESQPIQLESQTWDIVFWHPGVDLPLQCIMIPLTQRCNLKCPICPRQNSTHLDNADVSDDVLDPLLEAAPHYIYAGLQGLGEPLLNKDVFRIAAKFRRAIPPPSLLATTTNGMLLDAHASRRLIDLGLNSLIVSLDGATKEVFENARPGADFDVVIRHVSQAVDYGRKSGRKRLWFSANFVTNPNNLHEIPAVVKLAHSLGIDAIALIHMRDLKTGEICTWDEEKLETLFEEAGDLGLKLGIRVVIPAIRGHKSTRCVFMQSANVWLSGDVVPCLRMEPDGSPWPIRTFGNVRDTPLLDIWDSHEYREFRHQVMSGDSPEVCRDCNFCDGRVV